MQTAPHPEDEIDRLRALLSYEVLDTDPEPAFDELTELLAEILQVPVALVSLIDDKRQWFKSHHGLDATETPRELAFCAHAILEDSPLIVEDSSQDVRFADNPLVTGAPHVRFYAGMPLITPTGHRLGTLCGIDHKPRQLSERQRRALEIVSRQVMAQLELRKQLLLQQRVIEEQDGLMSNMRAYVDLE